nr:S8 family serine peptidase [uncultured Chryseobacterium sp.]
MKSTITYTYRFGIAFLFFQYSNVIAQSIEGKDLPVEKKVALQSRIALQEKQSASSRRIKAYKLYPGQGLGLSISGQGMIIGQWDYSKPRMNHNVLAGKITYREDQNQTLSRHSTHIAAILMGNNIDSLTTAGVAYDATSRAYDWVNDTTEMTTEALGGMLVASNSYGYDPIYLQTYQFGKYNTKAREWDNIMYNAPYFQIVKAVGNARSIDSSIAPQVVEKQGYDLLEGGGIAKNVLVVTSVDENVHPNGDDDFTVSSFSSYGPTDDGRIKPDIAAQGEHVYSSIEAYNSAYGYYNGTSSASASVAGGITLLQQYWKTLTPDYMWSSSVRAMLAHTANDKGTPGPDYVYGWGLMDTERAAQLMYSNNKSTLVKEENLANGKEYRLYVVAGKANQEPLVATLAWTDPAGNIGNTLTDDETKALINDLDITLVKKDDAGNIQTFYPWKLGGMKNYTAAATKNSANSVDNVEKVEIENPDGLYQVVIKHKGTLQQGNQNFSLILSGVSFCYADDRYVLVREKDNIDTSDFVGTAKEIKASNVIESTAKVTYKAGRSVELLPDASGGNNTVGFETAWGADFLGYVDPDCGTIDLPLLYKAQSPVRATDTRASVAPVHPITTEASDEREIYPNPAHNH